MMIYDAASHYPVADPEKPIAVSTVPSLESIRLAADDLILSASGWRKVFARGGEEDRSGNITVEDMCLSGIMAYTFAQYLHTVFPESLRGINGEHVFPKDTRNMDNFILLVGMDSRFTGSAISDAMCRVFISLGFGIRHLFITPIPQLLAYAASLPVATGYVYISASHNPVGHNGLKFGFCKPGDSNSDISSRNQDHLSDLSRQRLREGGSVLNNEDSAKLIDLFRKNLEDPEIPGRVWSLIQSAAPDRYSKCLEGIKRWREESAAVYMNFAGTVASGTVASGTVASGTNRAGKKTVPDSLFTILRKAAEKRPAGIIGELNGSARTLSIDQEILASAGVKVKLFNSIPGEIVHSIVPEGKNLDLCAKLLEHEFDKDPSYIMGYVPDNDGDRGNLVRIDESTGKAEILQAQEVFALTVLSELAWSRATGEKNPAVAVNGPTSMRIDRIAEAFGARVFRSETGEANVVNLARSERKAGFSVRILGEGSNGGNITYPSAVRDPLNTLLSIIKLYLLREEPYTLFRDWCIESGNITRYRENFTFGDIIDTLPSFTTTGAFEPRALLKVETPPAVLKQRYEEIFLGEWKEKKGELLSNYGITGYRVVNYEGTCEREGMGKEFRTGKEKGGLKIIFSNEAGRETDFIWMRSSGTEPVFRVMADCEGNDWNREKFFLKWHTAMIQAADNPH